MATTSLNPYASVPAAQTKPLCLQHLNGNDISVDKAQHRHAAVQALLRVDRQRIAALKHARYCVQQLLHLRSFVLVITTCVFMFVCQQ